MKGLGGDAHGNPPTRSVDAAGSGTLYGLYLLMVTISPMFATPLTGSKEHAHAWAPYLNDATGYFVKRENGEQFSCAGRVSMCVLRGCQSFLFHPNNPELRDVECEVA